MDTEMKNNEKLNIDDIPELNLDVLDEIATDEVALPEIDMEVIEYIFDEADKNVQLFEEEEFDADTLAIFDQGDADLLAQDELNDDDDLVFVDAISVRDRRKINKIHMHDGPEAPDLEPMKTRRRSHDKSEVKKERSIAFAKKNIVVIGIGILILLIIIGAISVGVRKFKENHSSVPSISAGSEAYQVEAQEAINKMITDYFTALADHDTYVLKEVLSPVYDNELLYNGIVSDYVDGYENVTCYAKEGLEEGDYLVAVYYEMKYSKVRTVAPGMQFFYVKTDQDNELYIDNVYCQHNLIYKESETDPNIENLLSSFRAEPDLATMIEKVQSDYDDAISSNSNLKEMVEVIIPEALKDWYTSMESYLDIQEEEPVIDQEEPGDTETEVPQVPEDDGVTEASGTVYVTDLINIRKSPSTDAEVLASATFGSDLKRIGVTEDGWTKIKTGDIVGYVKSEFVSESKPSLSAGVVVTLKESLNLRSGKDENSDLIETVPAGTSVKVVEPDSSGWTKVDYNGKTGYIRTDLLTAN